jgi:hypothetical protein
LRNSHDKSLRLAMTCGYRVFVCSNMAVAGDSTPFTNRHGLGILVAIRGIMGGLLLLWLLGYLHFDVH